jgi:hypothetical protein
MAHFGRVLNGKKHSASIFFLGGAFTVCRGKDAVTNAEFQYLLSTEGANKKTLSL